MKKYFKIILKSLILSFTLIITYLSFYGISRYTEVAKLFKLKNIKSYGHNFISEKEILAKSNIKSEKSIFDYDLNLIKANIEQLDFVKFCKVSRILPKTLLIQIIEKNPIILADIDGSQYFFDENLDSITYNRNALNFFPVPILSFNKDKNYDPIKIDYILQFVLKIKNNYQSLYKNISELRYNNELTIITDARTKIELGNTDFNKKIDILKSFERTLKNKRSFDDYSNINLQIQNQIIVKEKNRVKKTS